MGLPPLESSPPLTPLEISERYDVSLEVATAALHNILRGDVLFLTVSGKIGAGKDTVAPEVVSILGYDPAHHESFAGPLRDEVNQVIEIIHRASSQEEAIGIVEEELSASNVAEVVTALWEDVKSGAVTSSYERTTSTRRALQWWGTEVRRAVDDDYWVKKAIKSSLEKLASGTSIYVTDSRFPNEASSITDLGGTLIRLEVSRAEQERRILSRDGIISNPEALTHASETAMDNYPFPHVLDTDTLSQEATIEAACEVVRARPLVS